MSGGPGRDEVRVTALSFTVPGCPVPKARHRSGKGHAFTPSKTRRYEALIGLVAGAALRSGWPSRAGCLHEVATGKRAKCSCPWCSSEFAVTLHVYFPDRRSRDLDNVAKSILDGCNGVTWKDDRQVSELHIVRNYDKERPRVYVVIEMKARQA